MGKTLKNFIFNCKYPHLMSLIFSFISLVLIVIILILIKFSKKKLLFLSVIILNLLFCTFLIPFSSSINGIYNEELFFGKDVCKTQGFIVIFSQLSTDIWVLILIYYQYLIFIKKKNYSIKENCNSLIILMIISYFFPLLFCIYCLIKDQYDRSEYNFCFLKYNWEGSNSKRTKILIYIFSSIHIITFLLELFYIIKVVLFYCAILANINDNDKKIKYLLQLLAFPILYILSLFFYTINNIYYFLEKEPNFIYVKIGNVLINVCSIIIPIVYGISSGLIKKNKYLTIENSNNNSEFSRSSSETKIDENLSELIHI